MCCEIIHQGRHNVSYHFTITLFQKFKPIIMCVSIRWYCSAQYCRFFSLHSSVLTNFRWCLIFFSFISYNAAHCKFHAECMLIACCVLLKIARCSPRAHSQKIVNKFIKRWTILGKESTAKSSTSVPIRKEVKNKISLKLLRDVLCDTSWKLAPDVENTKLMRYLASKLIEITKVILSFALLWF